MNRDSLAHGTGVAPAAGGPKIFRLLLLTGAVLLFASALTLRLAGNHTPAPAAFDDYTEPAPPAVTAVAPASAPDDPTQSATNFVHASFALPRQGRRRTPLPVPSRTNPQPTPTLEAKPASLSLCPGRPSTVQLTVRNVGRRPELLDYAWQPSGGSIPGKEHSVAWDLSGVGPGTYTATVTMRSRTPVAASIDLTRTARVVVRECRTGQAQCPSISMRCKGEVVEGEPLAFTGTLGGGGTRRGDPTTSWSLSAGEIIGKQGGIVGERGTETILVRTDGMGGRSIRATLAVGGYGLECSRSCETKVSARPTPTPDGGEDPPPVGGASPTASVTPTPQLTPTPGQSPSPSPSASPSASATASTSTTPSASPTPVPSTRAAAGGWLAQNLWLVLLLAALCVGALLLAQQYLLPLLAGAGRESPDPEGLGAILVGGQKKVADQLKCSVFAPEAAAPGDSFLVQAFAHLAEQAPLLDGMAKEADRHAARRGVKALGEIERGHELSFHLQMPGLEIDEPSQSIVWRGEVEAVQFGVKVPETFKPRSVNCKLTVSHHSIPLGHVKFTLDFADAPRPDGGDGDTLKSFPDYVRYRRAFISYASEDRAEVLRRVQMLSLLKVQCFQDVLSLEPGARWEEKLYRYIDRSDVFFLFWSAAAYKSEWVEKEVQYALRRKGGDDDSPPEIVPVILQGPPEVPPPSYLPEYHFNDPYAFFIRAEDATRRDEKRS